MDFEFIKGASHIDHRGKLLFNNNFDLRDIKRMYFIENCNEEIVRGWQGHKIEQRWLCAVYGVFKISLVKVDDWTRPSRELQVYNQIIQSETFEILHVPSGYVTAIRAEEPFSKLLLFSDYLLGDVEDEYRFDLGYFKNYFK